MQHEPGGLVPSERLCVSALHPGETGRLLHHAVAARGATLDRAVVACAPGDVWQVIESELEEPVLEETVVQILQTTCVVPTRLRNVDNSHFKELSVQTKFGERLTMSKHVTSNPKLQGGRE